jgi:hypothetical protein
MYLVKPADWLVSGKPVFERSIRRSLLAGIHEAGPALERGGSPDHGAVRDYERFLPYSRRENDQALLAPHGVLQIPFFAPLCGSPYRT